MYVWNDPRVIWFNGGTSYDSFHTTNVPNAMALIKEYGLNVKYGPYTMADGIVRTEIF